MTAIFLIRHGLTGGNLAKLVMGRGAHPINDEGRTQAMRLAEILRGIRFDIVYSSPSARTVETARILMDGRGGTPFVMEPDVDEIEFGEWVGKTMDDIKDDTQFSMYMFKPTGYVSPGGESVLEVQERSVRAVEKIKEANKGKAVAIVSHADVIKTIIAYYMDLDLDNWQQIRIDNASFSVLRFSDDGKPRVIAVNCMRDVERYCA